MKTSFVVGGFMSITHVCPSFVHLSTLRHPCLRDNPIGSQTTRILGDYQV
jgi:hypothetical protein